MDNVAIVAELCIYILTWNVGGHNPTNNSLSDVLSLNGTSNCPGNRLPDIYVLGFQKVTRDPINQMKNVLLKHDQWTLKATNELSHYGYEKVKVAQMQGILLNVWTKKEHVLHIRDIEAKETGIGKWSDWSGKGAVGVRLSLYDTAVTFIVAHLPGRYENVEKRVNEYKQIVKNHRYESSGYRDIFDHAVVFWFGDLHFRIDPKVWDVRGEIEMNNLSGLYANDQLTMVRRSGEAFSLMDEQQPTFNPNYKFLEGSTSEYDRQRLPAWSDRILYRVNETQYHNRELKLQPLSYKSYPGCTLSTHKPVTAEFLYTIKNTGTFAADGKLHS